MGTTSKPVKILVLDPDLYESPEVQALIEKGHHVRLSAVHTEIIYDLIIGRRAWYMDAWHLRYLEKIAIPAARKRQANREREASK